MKTFSFFFLNFLFINTVSAQSDGRPFGPGGILSNLFTDLTSLISKGAIGLIIGLTIATFFWVLFRGMLRSQGGTDIAKNKDTLLWGIAILFVMVSIWGIIIFLQDALIKDYKDKNITLPSIPIPDTGNRGNPPAGNPNSAGRASGKLIIGSDCTVGNQCATNFCSPKKKCDFDSGYLNTNPI